MRLRSSLIGRVHGTPFVILPSPVTRRAARLAVATGLAVVLAAAAARGVTAENDGRRTECSNRTLRGEYGFLVSGIRGTGPTTTESFVGVGLRAYDGRGGLADKATFHGQITGIQGGEGVDPVSGTYEVNPDCTGTSTVLIPNLPFPIVSTFVIVRSGEQVKEIVVSPPPNVVTAVFDRK